MAVRAHTHGWRTVTGPGTDERPPRLWPRRCGYVPSLRWLGGGGEGPGDEPVRGAALRPRRAGLATRYSATGTRKGGLAMGRAAASRTEGDSDALEELRFHWGDAYDIGAVDGVYTTPRRDGRGGRLADPSPKGCSGRSGLTTRRCRCPGTCRERAGNAPSTPEPDRACLIADGGPAAVHDLHPGTGPPGGSASGCPACGRLTAACAARPVRSAGPGGPGAGGHAVRFREDSPRELARAPPPSRPGASRIRKAPSNSSPPRSAAS